VRYDIEHSPLPTMHSVRVVLEGLVGRTIDFSDCHAVPRISSNVRAVYATDEDQLAAVAVTDIQGAARLGGALGMLPKGGVDDVIDDHDLTGLIRDNVYEVLNVLGSVFNVADAPHVRLTEMYGPGQSAPDEVENLAYAAGGRLDIEVSIAGYGNGRLCIVVR
jgi:hypothetical protein